MLITLCIFANIKGHCFQIMEINQHLKEGKKKQQHIDLVSLH